MLYSLALESIVDRNQNESSDDKRVEKTEVVPTSSLVWLLSLVTLPFSFSLSLLLHLRTAAAQLFNRWCHDFCVASTGPSKQLNGWENQEKKRSKKKYKKEKSGNDKCVKEEGIRAVWLRSIVIRNSSLSTWRTLWFSTFFFLYRRGLELTGFFFFSVGSVDRVDLFTTQPNLFLKQHFYNFCFCLSICFVG